MKSIPVGTLKSGSQFTNTAWLDEGYILLTPDVPVSDSLINRLKLWGYREIFSPEGAAVQTSEVASDLEPEFTPGSLQNDLDDAKNIELTQKFYVSLMEFTHKIFDLYLKKNVLPVEPITEQVKNLINELKIHRKYLLRLTELDRNGFSYVTSHSVNVAILSVAIADTMKLPSHKLIEVGIAGLLHEIGMFKLPDSFQNANRALSPEERRALSAHPILGYRILKELGYPPNVTMAVLEHHEKEDGTGYPQNLTGDKITISAKILAVASGFDAQISHRPYRPAKNGHASILDMLKDIRKAYDDQILKRLIFTLGLYPVGNWVVLKNNVIAQVIDTNQEDPKSPVLRIMTDDKHNPVGDKPIIRLSDRTDMTIMKVLDSNEVKALRADNKIP